MSQMEHARGQSTRTSRPTGKGLHTRVEQLHIRNFDPDRAYRIQLQLSQPGNPPTYQGTFEVGPRGVESAFELAPPGLYDVEVRTAFDVLEERAFATEGSSADTAECNVGEGAAQTIVIECGNGIVSVSEGLNI